MERYDYRNNTENDILVEVEELNKKQRQAVHDAIQKVREETEEEAIQESIAWFDNSILPLLKEYAELTSSILDVERDKRELIQATLRNSCGLEITETCKGLYMALIMAVQIIVDIDDKDLVLVLTYDCRKFVN